MPVPTAAEKVALMDAEATATVDQIMADVEATGIARNDDRFFPLCELVLRHVAIARRSGSTAVFDAMNRAA